MLQQAWQISGLRHERKKQQENVGRGRVKENKEKWFNTQMRFGLWAVWAFSLLGFIPNESVSLSYLSVFRSECSILLATGLYNCWWVAKIRLWFMLRQYILQRLNMDEQIKILCSIEANANALVQISLGFYFPLKAEIHSVCQSHGSFHVSRVEPVTHFEGRPVWRTTFTDSKKKRLKKVKRRLSVGLFVTVVDVAQYDTVSLLWSRCGVVWPALCTQWPLFTQTWRATGCFNTPAVKYTPRPCSLGGCLRATVTFASTDPPSNSCCALGFLNCTDVSCQCNPSWDETYYNLKLLQIFLEKPKRIKMCNNGNHHCITEVIQWVKSHRQYEHVAQLWTLIHTL